MLTLDHVTKHYKEFDLDCTMEVRPGCVTGLIGKNGAGKSTTFKAILGLIRCDGGSIHLFGKEAWQLGASDRRQLGVVLSDAGFGGYLTIQDLVPVLCSMYPDFRREDFLKKCRELSLPMTKKIKELSTGMKQKLHVLAAVSHGSRLLILDEPTNGLDVIARDELLGMLRDYMEEDGRAILISSHISADLEGFCDDLYMIDNGRIVLHEETDVLLSDYAVLKMTEEQFGRLDKAYILRYKEEHFGYKCMTDQKQFYLENYPDIAIEKGSIDELIMMMVQGRKLEK